MSYRIAGAIGVLLVVISAIVTGGTYVSMRRDAFQEKHALVDVMSYTLETTLADAPRSTLQRVVENCSTIAGIRKIVILDRHGIALASSERIEVGAPSSSRFVAAFLDGAVFARAAHVTEDSYVLVEPLRGRGTTSGSQRDIVGAAEITMRLDAIDESAKSRAKTVLGVSLGGYVILCAALALVLRGWVTRPISLLADAADGLRRGERRRGPVHAPDEVGRLSHAFDAMADRIDAMVSGLEEEVATRTADLMAERRALRREKELLELLFEVTATANEAKGVEGALSEALEKVCQLTGWPAAIVYMADKECPPRLVPTSIRRTGAGFSWPASMSLEKPMELGEGLAGRVLEAGAPLVEGRMAAFPILIGADVVGVMEFFLGDAPEAEERLLAAMGTVGTELGRVIERREVERLKEEFVSTVSHELRTPLTAIRGSLGLLHHGVLGSLSEEAHEVVSIANESCERLVRLINDLLDMQKLVAGRMELRVERLPIVPLLAKVMAANEGFALTCGVRLVLHDQTADALVAIDQDRVAQIVTNLLSNAVKFSPAGGEVTLRASTTKGRVRVEVGDRGPGIPEAFRVHIFERFAQGDASSTRRIAGTGLGLGIAKALVELHGGTIGFSDREGGGTLFYFEIAEAAGEA